MRKRFLSLFLFLCISLLGACVHTSEEKAHETALAELPRLPTEELAMELDARWRGHPNGENKFDEDYVKAIRKELLRRRPLPLLFSFAIQSQDFAREQWFELLSEINSPDVLAFFQSQRTRHPDNATFIALLYIAKKRCPHGALESLTSRFFEWSVSPELLAGAARVLGKCHYRAAAPQLLQALDTDSTDVSAEALESLKRLYPGGPDRFDSLKQAKTYYQKRWNDAHAE